MLKKPHRNVIIILLEYVNNIDGSGIYEKDWCRCGGNNFNNSYNKL